MPTCLVVQHVAPESAFAIEDALLAAGVEVDTRQVFIGDGVPMEATGLDGVIVMGGPMSAASDQGFPTRWAELKLLSDAMAAGIPTLGVCLGAQMLAVAAGATVHSGELGPEIGWSPVNLGEACREDPIFTGLPPNLTVLQWHGDTFEMPAGGRLLMSNSTYPHQAFRIGAAAWGVQFHLEVTAAAVHGFLDAFGADTEGIPGGAETIAAETPAAVAALAEVRDLVFSRFAGLVAARIPSRDLVSEA